MLHRSASRSVAWHADIDALGAREQPSPGRRVLVIGSGIGGLSAALCLASVGAEVLVFEAAAEIAELGVGLNVQPEAVGVLTELGLLPALDAVGVRTAELLMMTRRGQLVLRQRAGWPLVPSIHSCRSTGDASNKVLLARLTDLAPGATHVGHRLRALEETGGRATAVFDVDDQQTVVRR